GVGQLMMTMKRVGAAGATVQFSDDFVLYQVIQIGSSLVAFVTGSLAMVWFGMWMGVITRKANMAVIKTLLFVQVLPWIVLMFILMGLSMTIAFSGSPMVRMET